jgi:hypothetical protein
MIFIQIIIVGSALTLGALLRYSISTPQKEYYVEEIEMNTMTHDS